MASYVIGLGEKRIVRLQFADFIPAGAAIAATPAPTVHVETWPAGVLVATGFTVTSIQIQGTDLLFFLEVAESVAPGNYALEGEVTLDNGERGQSRDPVGNLMRFVVPAA